MGAMGGVWRLQSNGIYRLFVQDLNGTEQPVYADAQAPWVDGWTYQDGYRGSFVGSGTGYPLGQGWFTSEMPGDEGSWYYLNGQRTTLDRNGDGRWRKKWYENGILIPELDYNGNGVHYFGDEDCVVYINGKPQQALFDVEEATCRSTKVGYDFSLKFKALWNPPCRHYCVKVLHNNTYCGTYSINSSTNDPLGVSYFFFTHQLGIEGSRGKWTFALEEDTNAGNVPNLEPWLEMGGESNYTYPIFARRSWDLPVEPVQNEKRSKANLIDDGGWEPGLDYNVRITVDGKIGFYDLGPEYPGDAMCYVRKENTTMTDSFPVQAGVMACGDPNEIPTWYEGAGSVMLDMGSISPGQTVSFYYGVMAANEIGMLPDRDGGVITITNPAVDEYGLADGMLIIEDKPNTPLSPPHMDGYIEPTYKYTGPGFGGDPFNSPKEIVPPVRTNPFSKPLPIHKRYRPFTP